MLLREYQAKQLLRAQGLPLPRSSLIDSADGAPPFLPCVLKVQIPVGGRGKAGGVQFVRTNAEFSQQAKVLLREPVLGHYSDVLLAEELLPIVRELYIAITLDRSAQSMVLLAQREGGIEVEQTTQDTLLRQNLSRTPTKTQSNRAGKHLGLSAAQTANLHDLLTRLWRVCIAEDAVLAEINPLVLTTDGRLVCADAKIELDDTAAFRHTDHRATDPTGTHQFVGLSPDGTIASMANGAGLAMATVDAIQSAGATPANFFDIGGGASVPGIVQAFRRIAALPRVKAVVINIFGGITRCDDVARAIIQAQAVCDNLPPLFIRLTGTNEAAAKKILAGAGIPLLPTLAECIQRALDASIGAPTLSSLQAPLLAKARFVYAGNASLSGGEGRGSGPESSLLATLRHNPAVIVQGITGVHGSFHTAAMRAAGTAIVAGVTPGKAGRQVDGIPVYDNMADARNAHPTARISVVFVPAAFAKTALLEAIGAGIRLIVCITEGIPVHDMLAVGRAARQHGATILGPNSPGLLLPGSIKLGIIPATIGTPGTVGIISRSGTLTYEAAASLSAKGVGQSAIIGIGGDRLRGLSFVDCLQLLEADPYTERIALIGEIGGQDEQLAAAYIRSHMSKPVYAYIAGHSAPPAVQLGHAGAIMGGQDESADAKTTALAQAGAITGTSTTELLHLIAGHSIEN